MRVAVLGAGVFGAAAARELARRGHAVALHDVGPIPRPEAASTDISKLVRADYGADRLYRDLGLHAIAGWEAWNRESGRPLYHPDGLLVLAAGWEPGGFERESEQALAEAGVALRRFDAPPGPAWRWSGGGYVNPVAGWVEAAEVVRWLVGEAAAAGAEVLPGSTVDPRAAGADRVVVAAGVWSKALVPALAPLYRVVGQPVFHLRPADPEPWRAPRFLPWCADIANTGWYGFPATADGIVKIANHGAGVEVSPDAERTRGRAEDEALAAFLAAHLPGLSSAPIVARRACLYTDTFDGDFVIDAVPGEPGTVVATGGSGHAFKFAPLLGELVANAVEGRADERLRRFRWRAPGVRRAEAARHLGEGG